MLNLIFAVSFERVEFVKMAMRWRVNMEAKMNLLFSLLDLMAVDALGI